MRKIDKRLLEPEKKSRKPLTEQEEWARAGCANNAEWHDHLNKLLWQGYDKG